jgi:hypothetical protein
MSGFKTGNIDLDDVFIVESNSDNRSTGYKMSDGSDLINRYRLRSSDITQGDPTGYKVGNNDLSDYFVDKTNVPTEAVVKITSSAGEPVIPVSVMHHTPGYPYSVANGTVLSFSISNLTPGKQLQIQKIYGGNGGYGISSRYGSRGGHSYAVSLDGTLLAVAGAGGGCGAGNGHIGASAFYDGLTEPYDYNNHHNPNGTTNWGNGMTIGGYVDGNNDRYWYGLNARPWHAPGGDGGSHEDMQTGIYYSNHGQISKRSGWNFNTTYYFSSTYYGYSGKGGYLHGGDGGSSRAAGSHLGRDRSSGGGGGGAGYIGGGGAAGILTTNGSIGSPGGGSGSSYLNQSLCTFNSLTQNVSFGNENVEVSYLYTVSGQSNNSRETLTINDGSLDENGLYVKTF